MTDNGVSFITGGLFQCDTAHRPSVAVLCMLHKIWCNPMHPVYSALPGPHVKVLITRGALVAHRYIYSIPRCRTSQYHSTFTHLSVCWRCETILLTIESPTHSMVWDWRVSRPATLMLFYWPKLLHIFLSSTIFPFLFFLSVSFYYGAVVFGLIWCRSLTLDLAVTTSFNNDNKKI